MFGERTETDRLLPHLIVKYQPFDKRDQGRHLEILIDC